MGYSIDVRNWQGNGWTQTKRIRHQSNRKGPVRLDRDHLVATEEGDQPAASAPTGPEREENSQAIEFICNNEVASRM